jgi:signal transduction histidine kinase
MKARCSISFAHLLRCFLAVLAGVMPILPTYSATERAIGDIAASPPVQLSMGDLAFDSAEKPPQNATWLPARLPDDWNTTSKEGKRVVWYRLRFTSMSADGGAWAIYLPRVAMTATVFLNNEFVGATGNSTQPDGRYWNRPLLISSLTPHVTQGENLLLIRVQAMHDEAGGLGPVYVGDAATLSRAHFWRWLLQVLLPEITSVAVLLTCAFTGLLWLKLRNPADGLFTLAGLSWSLRAIDYYATSLPLSGGAIQLVVAVLAQWFVVFLVLLICELLNQNSRLVRRLLWSSGWIASCMMVMTSSPSAPDLARGIHFGAMLTEAAAIGWLIFRLRKSVPLHGKRYLVALTMILLLGIHDLLQRFDLISFDQPRLAHLGALLLVLMLASVVFHRYVVAARLMVAQNKELDERVRQRTHELESLYQSRVTEEKVQAGLRERERIMRDMHDGLGAQLTLAISSLMLSSPNIKDVRSHLQDCMLDLRLMLDSLEPIETDLSSVLGNLRYRLEPTLRSKGIRLIWKVSAITTPVPMNAQFVLNVQRIFQEAFANVVKHSNATEVSFTAFTEPGVMGGDVVMQLTDNGSPAPDLASAGHGLANMHQRAALIGGKLNVAVSPGSMMIELRLPALAFKDAAIP